MRCILGIGNPGATYDGTRHNLGFAVVDELARRHASGAWSRKWSSLVSEWRMPPEMAPVGGDDKALLVKPQTFVNVSGDAAQAILAFFKAPVSDLLVVVDDLNLALGHLRLRADGSAGGHNGLRDIEAKIGNHYPRLRLGMGPLPPGGEQVAFVLGGFSPGERREADAMVAKAADCAEAWLREGVVVACRYNGPLVRPEPAPQKPPRPAAPNVLNAPPAPTPPPGPGERP